MWSLGLMMTVLLPFSSAPTPTLIASVQSHIEVAVVALTLGGTLVGMTAANSDGGDGDDRPRAAIYARVSSREQAKDGKSLDKQVTDLVAEVAERGLNLVTDPITDDAETGTDFDRPGIRKITRLAQRGVISHVLVDDVDRIGRHTAETLYYLWELSAECDVTIITLTDGELDATELSDFIQINMKSVAAQMANENRARRANMAKLARFREDQNWRSWFGDPPLGYQLPDAETTNVDAVWPTPDPDQVEAVEDLFTVFLNADHDGAYSRTCEVLENLHGRYLPANFDRRTVKRLLQRPLYIGRPTPTYEGEEYPVDDPDLQLIDEDTFEAVQQKIAQIRDKYSADNQTNPVDEAAEEFGEFAVWKASRKITQRCLECGCTDLNKYGSRTVGDDDRTAYIYKCPDCHNQQKFPTEDELDEMNDSD